MAESWSAKNPYPARLKEKRILNGEESIKETMHFVVDLGDSGLQYKAGDALGFVPSCPPGLVQDLLDALSFSGDEPVETAKGTTTIRDALMHEFEIHRASKKFIIGLAELFQANASSAARLVARERSTVGGGSRVMAWTWSGEDDDVAPGWVSSGGSVSPEVELWGRLLDDEQALEDYLWSRDYVDVLADFPDLTFTPQSFIQNLDRMKPRLYSIASSPDFEPGTVHLTVAIVRYSHHDRDRSGLCTGWLADDVDVGSDLTPVFMSPTRNFVLPEDGATDCIMVGPGTGIAPMRAFLQQRQIDGATGRNWLFFGDQHEKCDYLYEEELEGWVADGTLNHLTCAWSRDQAHKIYVQTQMAEHAAEIWEWIDGGAYFYVCGDKQYMAKDVHETLITICEEHGGMSREDAVTFVERRLMKEEKRYLRDVY